MISLILILSGVSLIVFAAFSPKTHLELEITRRYKDGSTETFTYQPPLFQQSPTVQEQTQVDYTDTLQLYMIWVIQPEDWKPTIKLTVDATKQLTSSQNTLISEQEHWDSYCETIDVEHEEKTPCFEEIKISNSTLLTCFDETDLSNKTGTYTLQIAWTATYLTTDPMGVSHTETTSLTYTRKYEIKYPEAVYSISADLAWERLLSQQQSVFTFSVNRNHLLVYGTTLTVIGTFSIGLIFIVPKLCRVVTV